MRLSRPLLGLLGAVLFASLASHCLAQTDEPPQKQNLADRPAYPLVIRIDQIALDPLAVREINRRGQVDKVILGTHAVGESLTQGAIAVLLVPDRDDASFDLGFRGRTHTSTVGANGPALIYSHTDTNFVCTRRISLDPSQGFVAGASRIVADTKLTYDGFGSSRGLLGRRLISRVAERRAGESQERAQHIVARNNERELLLAFDKLVNTQLADMNKKLNIVLYKNTFLGEGLAVQIAARSSNECIYVAIGHEGSPSRLTDIPPRREVEAPVEIWVHSTILAKPVGKLLSLVEGNQVLPEVSRLEILQALLVPAAESDRIIDLAVYDDWIVLGLQNETLESSLTATAGKETSDSTKPFDGD